MDRFYKSIVTKVTETANCLPNIYFLLSPFVVIKGPPVLSEPVRDSISQLHLQLDVSV